MSKKIAIFSDVHSNLAAFEAVIEDSLNQNVNEYIFLGDCIGYGPNPNECIKLLRDYCDASHCLIGHHEYALLNGFEIWGNSRARTVLEWTKLQLTNEHLKFINSLQAKVKIDNILYVHGSPRDPTFEYITPHFEGNTDSVIKNFNELEYVCFNGHTHVPGVLTMEITTGKAQWLSTLELNNFYKINLNKTIINVGSVGQPRDDNPDACYVILERNEVTWRRVPYDIDRTVQCIYGIDKIDNFMANRLLVGR